jgi:hypothetical protein
MEIVAQLSLQMASLALEPIGQQGVVLYQVLFLKQKHIK